MKISETTSNKIANMGFLCSLLVVVIHLENVPTEVGSLAWIVHYVVRYIVAVAAVPFFFLVSGFFLAKHVSDEGQTFIRHMSVVFPNWWRQAVVKRLRTLGIPYLVWCLVPIILFTLCWPGYESGGECWKVLPKASAIRAAFGLNIFTAPEANRPLWYVRALLMLVAVSPVLVWLVRKGRHWTLVALLALYWSVNTWSLGAPVWWVSVRWRLVWIFGFALEGLFYFTVGLYLALVRRRDVPVASSDGNRSPPDATGTSRRLWVLGLMGLAIGLAGMVLEMKGIYAYGYPILVSIPLLMILLWQLTPSVKGPAVLVGSSFAIYVIHPIVIRALNASGLLPRSPWTMVPEWLLAVCLTVGLTWILRRYFPRCASFVFGGR